MLIQHSHYCTTVCSAHLATTIGRTNSHRLLASTCFVWRPFFESCRIVVSHLRVASSSSMVVSRRFVLCCFRLLQFPELPFRIVSSHHVASCRVRLLHSVSLFHIVWTHIVLSHRSFASSCFVLRPITASACNFSHRLTSSCLVSGLFAVCDVYDARFCLPSACIALFCLRLFAAFDFFLSISPKQRRRH